MLGDLPEELKRELDVVHVLRRSQDVPSIVEQAIELRLKYRRPFVGWLQLGIVNDDAARKAVEAALGIVMDHCMKIEHAKMKV
jgi:hypothetical protein